ncbi:Uracil-DNA glycosylase [uncultured virus]|nr:Uracil-DNA glycosylase [uncultured virus]
MDNDPPEPLKLPPSDSINMTLLEQIQKYSPPGWDFTDCELEIAEAEEDMKRLNEGGISYPPKIYTFAAFWETPFQSVRVVIIGQDPYHQEGMAMGLAFSTFRENKVPGSLANIFKEIKSCYPDTFTIPNHGDLRKWARQGVLLLNKCLTVRPGKPGSHGNIWMGPNNKQIKMLNASNPNIIWVLWGKEAQKLGRIIGEKGTKLISAHPSGLSANRGFFGNRHFILINDRLRELGEPEIDWNLD